MTAARMSAAEAATLLGVAPDAPLEAIQLAYRVRVRDTHPDRMPDATELERTAAAAQFDALVQARRTLIDRTPVIPIRVQTPVEVQKPAWHDRPTGVGTSLILLAILAFLLIAIVSVNDAFRMTGAPAPHGHPALTQSASLL